MPSRLLVAASCCALFLLALLYATSQTIPGAEGRLVAALLALVREGGTALVWWAGAAGAGLWLLRAVLRPTPGEIGRAARGGDPGPVRTSIDDAALALALGAALLLALGNALGTLGLLTRFGGFAGWLLPGAGVYLLARSLRDAPPAIWFGAGAAGARQETDGTLGRGGSAGLAATPQLVAIASAVIAILAAFYVAAAASAPGWLWSSEFKGYDALSYHLELPKIWILGQRPVGPIDGNVYSALPSFVEAAFVQLMSMRGSIVDGAIACQYWSMFAAAATALAIARLARVAAGAEAGLAAAILFLALPWALVVGTLAYNDLVPCLLLAAAWLLIERMLAEGRSLDLRGAAALALLAASAVGAKPTAVLFMALPLLSITILRVGPRSLRFAPLVVGVALAVLAPWLVRNALAYGNPLFPFAHGLFGQGPWTAEQFEIFAKGHGPAGTLADRLPLLWSQWIGHGLGAPPAPTEPWFPNWGVLPAAGLLGLAIESRRNPLARTALASIAVAIVGWLLFTHLKSRFLLPTAVPLAIGAALLLARVAQSTRPLVARILLAPAVILAVAAYGREPATDVRRTPDDAPEILRAPAAFIGDTSFMTGTMFAQDIERASPDMRGALVQQAPTAYFINHLLAKDARVVAVGYSTPFYLGRPIAWNTVWDRGALDQIADQAPGTPQTWGRMLHERGFTHLLVHPTMLFVWKASGWLNPQLDPDRWLMQMLQSHPAMRTSDGCFIVDLRQQRADPQQTASPPPASPAPTAAPPSSVP